MELTINSNAFVEMNKLFSVKEIKAAVTDYNIENNLLEGNVSIYGRYTSDNWEEIIDFKKEVPFTVVFKDENVYVDEIEVENFSYQEVINQGVEVRFDIVVEYELNKENIEEDDNGKEKEKDNIIEEVNEVVAELDDINDHEEIIEEFISELKEDNLTLEEAKDEITNNYESILDELFFEDRDNVEIKHLEKESNRVVFTKFKKNLSTYRVYYPKNDREIENISALENKSLDDIYKTNNDYSEKRRIILK